MATRRSGYELEDLIAAAGPLQSSSNYDYNSTASLVGLLNAVPLVPTIPSVRSSGRSFIGGERQQPSSSPPRPLAPPTSVIVNSLGEAAFTPRSYSARPLVRTSSISNATYVPLPTRSGRIPHLPEDEGIETRESELFNHYFDFASEDDEDPDFIPAPLPVDIGWDELLIPDSYDSSEEGGFTAGKGEDEDEFEIDSDVGLLETFLAHLEQEATESGNLVNGGGAKFYALPERDEDIQVGSTATTSSIPINDLDGDTATSGESQPSSIVPVKKVAPSKKRPLAATVALSPIDESTATPVKKAKVTKKSVNAASETGEKPKKRIKFTAEEVKERRKIRSALASSAKTAGRRAEKSKTDAEKMKELKKENEILKKQLLEITTATAAKEAAKRAGEAPLGVRMTIDGAACPELDYSLGSKGRMGHDDDMGDEPRGRVAIGTSPASAVATPLAANTSFVSRSANAREHVEPPLSGDELVEIRKLLNWAAQQSR